MWQPAASLYVDGSRPYDIVDGGRQGSSASTPTGAAVLTVTSATPATAYVQYFYEPSQAEVVAANQDARRADSDHASSSVSRRPAANSADVLSAMPIPRRA